MGARNIRPKGGAVKHPSALASVTSSLARAIAWGRKSK